MRAMTAVRVMRLPYMTRNSARARFAPVRLAPTRRGFRIDHVSNAARSRCLRPWGQIGICSAKTVLNGGRLLGVSLCKAIEWALYLCMTDMVVVVILEAAVTVVTVAPVRHLQQRELMDR